MKKHLYLPVLFFVISFLMHDNRLIAQGSTTHGNTDVQGAFKVSGLNDTSQTERLLIIDQFGNVRKGERVPVKPGNGNGGGGLGGNCPTANPRWKNNNGTLYLCPETANVAIGADTSSQKLFVNGNMAVNNTIKVGKNSLFIGNNSLGKINNLYTDNADLFIQSDPAHKFNTILNYNNTGNVGIGIDDPKKQLHIKTIHLPSGSGTGHSSHYGIRLEDELSGTGTAVWDLEPIGETGKFHIGMPDQPVQTFTEDKNIGMGTTNPLQKLDVRGGGHFSNKVGIGITSPDKQLHIKTVHLPSGSGTGHSSHYGIRLEDEFSGTGTAVWDLEPIGETGKFHIGKPGQPVQTFTDDGNVGIGTISPEVALHIDDNHGFGIGNITASGNNSSSDWNTAASLKIESANNALVLFTSGTFNERKSFIQSGHSTGNFSQYLGDLALNPFGGNVGVGTINPTEKLHVKGAVLFETGTGFAKFEQKPFGAGQHSSTVFTINSDNPVLELKEGTGSSATYLNLFPAGHAARIATNESLKFFIDADDNQTDKAFAVCANSSYFGGNVKHLFSIHENGQVQIGGKRITSGPHNNYKLAVDGKIVGKSIYATASNWADHILKKDYILSSLEKEAAFIEKNGHLEDVPCEADIMENGINLADMDGILLGEIEKNRLHLIQKNKEIKALKKENEAIKQENEVIKKEQEKMKVRIEELFEQMKQ